MRMREEINEIERELRTNISNGLDEKQVEERKLQFGENKLADKKKLKNL